MAKKLKKTIFRKAGELVTSKERTRAGFIAMALEKNYMAKPYIDEAKALKTLAQEAKKPSELLKIEGLNVGLLTASGLSDKSLNYLTIDDKLQAIKGLIKEFLEPAGDDFINELVYRYLLTKGDALGGRARNLAGALGERKFLRSLLSILNLGGINYKWRDSESNSWLEKSKDDTDIENRIKGLYWKNGKLNRLLILNTKVPVVNKNVDLSLLEGTIEDLKKGKESITHDPSKFIALGELKGGIDPAGADEHWKTANSALNRIRTGFKQKKLTPHTFFIGAAIENSMATEIFKQLQSGTMDSAANLTDDDQLNLVCNWIVNL